MGLALLTAFVPPCRADEAPCEVAVAALNLPAGHDGQLHWSDGDGPTTPIQLSKRYFSEPVKLKGRIIRFLGESLTSGTATDPPPEPLLEVQIPAGSKLAFVVLSSVAEAGGRNRWRGNVLRAEDWNEGSLRVLNAAGESFGIAAGPKRMGLAEGKSLDFQAADWSDPFPLQIFRLEPEQKLVFSSTWRVTPGRRELCLIGEVDGSIRLRSLVALAPQPREEDR